MDTLTQQNQTDKIQDKKVLFLMGIFLIVQWAIVGWGAHLFAFETWPGLGALFIASPLIVINPLAICFASILIARKQTIILGVILIVSSILTFPLLPMMYSIEEKLATYLNPELANNVVSDNEFEAEQQSRFEPLTNRGLSPEIASQENTPLISSSPMTTTFDSVRFGNVWQAGIGKVWWLKDYISQVDPRQSPLSHRLYIQSNNAHFKLMEISSSSNCFPTTISNPDWNYNGVPEQKFICNINQIYKPEDFCVLYLQSTTSFAGKETKSDDDICKVQIRLNIDGQEKTHVFAAGYDKVWQID